MLRLGFTSPLVDLVKANAQSKLMHSSIPPLRSLLAATFAVAVSLMLTSCDKPDSGGASAKSSSGPAMPGQVKTVGVAFETLQTEYWVAGFEAIKAELKKRDITMLEAVADSDASRQLQQVKTFITRGVDGIILVPKDAKTCIPMIRAANAAKIPIVLFNRPADKSDAVSTAVVADNRTLTRDTVAYMIEQARKTGT